ncbi:heterokaryon incompatibility protein-domain-containing protein [Apiospora hydei]|uniref:Heterokaryon incompatibility protein-domain-containing protein n=1 Tax=Apiospora hydei TaxID=1337664 RepID=A0ABR1UV28_9PEZI
MLKTTTETLSSHLNGIAIADLPQSFQDAVDITRRLGIRYLWIDSLCIIQDCKKDWDSEAQRMAEIYESSHVTIAATDSLNGDGGCYRRPTKELNHDAI